MKILIHFLYYLLYVILKSLFSNTSKVFDHSNWALGFNSTRRMDVCGAILPLPQYVLMEWYLVKRRDKFTSYLTFRYLKGKGTK